MPGYRVELVHGAGGDLHAGDLIDVAGFLPDLGGDGGKVKVVGRKSRG